MSIISKLLNLTKRSHNAKQESGVGYLRQLGEFIALARSPNLIGPSEYFDYRLYDPALSAQEKRQFLGYKAERTYSRLNHASWHGTANDKILFEQVMITAGFAVPKTLAIYHPWRVAGPYCLHIRTRDGLGNFLAGLTEFPIFVKPVHGLFGRGANVIVRYDAAKKTVATHDNPRMSLEEFHNWIETNTKVGMLFQKMMVPSPEVQQVCGSRLSGVRMNVLCDSNGPRLFRANWKLCTGNNIVNNIEDWTNGNVMAAVDHTTGFITAARRGIGGEPVAVDEHPDTRAPLIGAKVPNWDAMRSFVEDAARAFPGLRFQAWDIAATEDGICAIELNLATLHTVHATQLVSHQGFLDKQLSKALAQFL